MTDWVTVGRVGRPHGLDGSFVVEAASDDAERFAPGARVYLRREPASIVHSKRAGNRLVVRLDRPSERGALLELPVAELPAAGEGRYYVFELIGLPVEEEDGRTLGRVQDVGPGVANDVLGVALPMVEECVLAVDLEGGRIVVAPGFTGAS